jgi:hypothetical protein
MIEIEKIQDRDIQRIIENDEENEVDFIGVRHRTRPIQPFSNYDTIKLCIQHIPDMFQPPRCPRYQRRHRYNSYKGKHDLEEKLGIYVSNGEFIIAMLYLGYSGLHFHKDLNYQFFCKKK